MCAGNTFSIVQAVAARKGKDKDGQTDITHTHTHPLRTRNE